MSSLVLNGGGEENPFRPTLLSSDSGLTPEGQEFFREQTESLRAVHNAGMAGDSTVSWERMTQTSPSPLYTAGSMGRFWHPLYGLIQGRYVQFVDQAALPLGAPQGLRVQAGVANWRATNQIALSHADLVLGVTAAFEAPKDGEWGWLITQGVNFHESICASPLSLFGRFVWHGDGQVGRGIGRVLGSSMLKQSSAVAPPGSLVIELGWDSLEKIHDSIGFLINDLEGQLLTLRQQLVEIETQFEGGDAKFTRLTREILDLRTNTYQSLDRVTMELRGLRNYSAAQSENLLTIINNNQMAQATRIEELSATFVTFNSAADIADGRAKTIMEARFSEEIQVRATADESLATRITSLEASGSGITEDEVEVIVNARVATEETARIAADNALATRLTTVEANYTSKAYVDAADGTLQTNITTVNGRVATEETVRANADAALSTRVTTVEANYVNTGAMNTAINAAVSTEATARANADTALATSVTNLTATVNTKGRIHRGTSAPAWTPAVGDAWFDTGEAKWKQWNGVGWFVTEDARIAVVAAAVTTEATARANADTALASDITTVSTTVGGHTTTIGQHTTSINGIEGRWGVTVDVNGHISGIQLLSGVGGSAFTVRADLFQVIQPGASGRVIFEVTPTYVRFSGRLLADGLMGGTLDNGDINVGSARMIYNNGTVMRVQGTGFGTVNQFIDWFGPTLANVNMCAESNATFYLKTNGSAYFGGALTAGTLTTRAASSSLSTTADVTTAVFGSNGNLITVVFSWAYESGAYTVYNANSSGVAAFNGRVSAYGATSDDGEFYSGSVGISGGATIQLWRSIGGGALVHVDTLVVTGGTGYFSGFKPVPGDHAGWGQESYVYQASQTFTDPNMSASNRQYRAVMLGRSAATLGSSPTQRLGITANE